MPTYTYKCSACEDVIEKRQSFSDPPLTTCEQCGGALRKVIHPVGIVFKGSGWYITDSRTASSSTVNGRESPTESSDKATTTSKSSETTGTDSKDAGSTTASSASSATSSAKRSPES